ncbi:DUF6734 family protein [Niabella hibiscisoli]|uniref:DUF6734 family protein n=1 Tax=Niabella hibiscisoli TaxID=1825928 RepID=UPI001F11613B|nr:DUF6734 family protein [Niabella hibiscisoli]MCH5716252.1 hypothetical protein [Niabella hibiscisoli]
MDPKKNLISENFGWLSPQYHLMGWALSCLKLTKNYENVKLYTDLSGKRALIDLLGLPYTVVFTDYDDLDIPQHLWALPKLLTYAKQEQPFLHVDGDVMLWEPIDGTVLSGEIIAQNLEIGTDYYKSLFEPLISKLDYVPPILKKNLTSRDMRSYNAGIIGGNDLIFFKKFVSHAQRFVAINKNCKSNDNLNIIFEQLLLFSLSKKHKKNVTCLKMEGIPDFGYKYKDFADFYNVDRLKYLHLIGEFKRDKGVCDMMSRHLLQENEEIFLRIVSLFKKQHYFYNTKIKQERIKNDYNFFTFQNTNNFLKSLNKNYVFKTNHMLAKDVSNSKNELLKELFKYEKKIKKHVLSLIDLGLSL